MTSRERLLNAIDFKSTDRVPISTYELCGLNSLAWENNTPSYSKLMKFIAANTETVAMWEPYSNTSLAMSASDFKINSGVKTEGKVTEIENSVKLDGIELVQKQKIFSDVMTVWQTKHWCSNITEVDALLKVKHKIPDYDFSDYARIKSEVADSGIIMSTIMDPLCIAADLMSFEDYTIWAVTETEHFIKTIQTLHERLMLNLEKMLKTQTVDLYRIVGAEYANTPYLPPYLYKDIVCPFVKDIADIVHKYGAKVRLHAHGNMAEHLDELLSVHIDSIDPMEEKPDGNTEIKNVKQKFQNKISIFGNMQLKLLETSTTEKVVEATKKLIDDAAAGGGFIIMPTASPINIPLSQKTEENYYAFIETALKYGKY